MEKENLIIAGVETALFRCGKGENVVLMVHGGPGFDHTSLLALRSLANENRQVIFYDQPGCGFTPCSDEQLTLDFYGTHLANLIESSRLRTITLVAHSWGALVLATALHKYPQIAAFIQRAILINPVPLDAVSFHAAAQDFITALPVSVIEGIQKAFLSAGAEGADFNDIAPYYFHNPSLAHLAPSYNKRVYFTVMGRLEPFDFYTALATLNRVDVVRSSHDIIPEIHLDRLKEISKLFIAVNGLGHFPYLENKEKFMQTLEEVLLSPG